MEKFPKNKAWNKNNITWLYSNVLYPRGSWVLLAARISYHSADMSAPGTCQSTHHASVFWGGDWVLEAIFVCYVQKLSQVPL